MRLDLLYQEEGSEDVDLVDAVEVCDFYVGQALDNLYAGVVYDNVDVRPEGARGLVDNGFRAGRVAQVCSDANTLRWTTETADLLDESIDGGFATGRDVRCCYLPT